MTIYEIILGEVELDIMSSLSFHNIVKQVSRSNAWRTVDSTPGETTYTGCPE